MPRILAASHAQRCAHCDVFVPAGKMQQHIQGKRHLSMLWYGRDGHRVRDIELHNDDGTLERRFRPFDVPERTVEAVRRARAAVTAPILVAHSGVVLFDRVCKYFEPERLCVAEMRTQNQWHVLEDRNVLASPVPGTGAGQLACIASRVHSSQTKCSINLSIVRPVDEIGQLALSFALHALADALGASNASHYVLLSLGNALWERRLATQLIDGLRRAINRNPELELFFCASGGAWRAEDAQTLLDAAIASRRARWRELAALTAASRAAPRDCRESWPRRPAARGRAHSCGRRAGRRSAAGGAQPRRRPRRYRGISGVNSTCTLTHLTPGPLYRRPYTRFI